LIKSFMSDRTTKDYIGLFFGTVIACFILTFILHSATSEAITPRITISGVFMLCLINLFVLLGFVHHVAQSCIADHIILKVADELKSALNRLTYDAHGDRKKPDEPKKKRDDWPKDFDRISKHLFFERSGYVQNINYQAILDFAQEHGCYIQIKFKAGHFLVSGEDGVRVYTKKPLPDDFEQTLKNYFIVGQSRTPTQDIEYSIRHMVEIAIRALSPGVNDSYTAVHVLDHLSSALAILFEKETPSENFYDESGLLRLKATQSGEDVIIFNALSQIRHNGGMMPSMIKHMLDKITILATLAKTPEAKTALYNQLKALHADLNQLDRYLCEREELETAMKDLMKELAKDLS